MTRFKKQELYDYLVENYSSKTKNQIINETGLSWNYIQKKSCLFGIKRDFRETLNHNTLIKLLNYDNISCYWIGFLLADGHLSKKGNIQINLSNKDEKHFLKIENHLEKKIKKYTIDNSVRFTISDIVNVLKIKEKFKWESNKTKIPIIVPDNFTYFQIFSLIIGFIDGDGYISKKGELTIKCDLNWKILLEYFHEFLTNEKRSFDKTKDDLSIIYIRFSKMREIKKQAIKLSLPIMDRKWERIDVNRILKSEKLGIAIDNLKNGFSEDHIINKYGFSKTLLRTAKQRVSNMI